jgi:tRNA uridine 5-carboxymethylaminomethyl modification enzyme
LDDPTIYPNGISSSLPTDVQEAFIRTMPGLEHVRIIRTGYAIEYDFLDPRGLKASLETKHLSGLFLAGQINGSTGYEEAGAQGLVAGLNAARRAAGKAPVTFGRDNSYIGVMIDDLVTRGVSEPYRMFTSRAEYRLSLRADNADQRLTPIGIEIGCVGFFRQSFFTRKMEKLAKAKAALTEILFTPQQAAEAGLVVNRDGIRRSAFDLLAYPDMTFSRFLNGWPSLGEIDRRTAEQIEIEAKYAVYLERQAAEIAAARRDEMMPIPSSFNFTAVDGLSNEIKARLSAVCPETLGQASRIEGVTPVAITLLAVALRRAKKTRQAAQA